MVLEPSIYDENILEWEQSARFNPGSDVEEEDDLGLRRATRCREVLDFAAEELPSDLREALNTIDRQDDCALRELANDDMLAFDWSHDPDTFKGEREIFTGKAGTTFPAEGKAPFIYDIINIIRETNHYGESLCKKENLSRYSRIRRWTPITSQKFWAFFGVLMLQSIAPLPVESEY